MDGLNTFLALLGRTEGRDKVLRLVQYACLHSVQHKIKGSTYKVYQQIRMVRKMLRFLRSLQYSAKIRQQISQLKGKWGNFPMFFKLLTSILRNLFTILFFLSDHRVLLSQLGVIQKKHYIEHYPKSMKYYFLQNVFGVLNNLIEMGLEIMEGNQKQQISQTKDKIKSFAFDLIRCLLDCLVALYYWKGTLPAKKIGILGVITSVMAIIQSLGFL